MPPPRKKAKAVLADVFRVDSDEEDDEQEEVALPHETEELIRMTAQWMVQNPERAAAVLENSRTARDERLEFLWASPATSPSARIYLKVLDELRVAETVKKVLNPPAVSATSGGASSRGQKRPRELLALPETIDSEKEVQLLQQRELQRIERKIREAAGLAGAAAAAAAPPVESAPERVRELYEERLREYESLADASTSEHRSRAKEMLKTANGALAQTLLAKKAQHLGSYLPRPELDSVIAAAAAAAAAGAASKGEAHEQNKLDAGNIGFQMLQKAGWKEGKGLGRDGGGTATPIAVATGEDRQGVGTATADAAATAAAMTAEDPYEEYRKRMQVAYRFRPNPLNNPRRSYY